MSIENISCIPEVYTNLKELNLSENPLSLQACGLHTIVSRLNDLEKLHVAGVPWLMNLTHGTQKSLLTADEFQQYVNTTHAFRKLEQEKVDIQSKISRFIRKLHYKICRLSMNI